MIDLKLFWILTLAWAGSIFITGLISIVIDKSLPAIKECIKASIGLYLLIWCICGLAWLIFLFTQDL